MRRAIERGQAQQHQRCPAGDEVQCPTGGIGGAVINDDDFELLTEFSVCRMVVAALYAGTMIDTSALSKFLYLSKPCCPGASGGYPLKTSP